MVVQLLILVLAIVGLRKVFTKAGKPGWVSIVPIYNSIVMLQIARKPLWWIAIIFLLILGFGRAEYGPVEE